MSLTQKRYIQLPLLFLIVFLGILPVEWTLLSQLPLYLGPVNILSILATYVVLTRSLARCLLWGSIIGIISALSYPFGYGALIAAFTWSVLATKVLTYALPFDSRIPFATLACYQLILCKVLWRLFTLKEYQGVTWLDFTLTNLPSLLPTALLSYLLLPLFVVWDDFFENSSIISSSDLKPRISGFSR